MKRILALLLTAAVLVSFYGCRGGREDFSGDESSTVSGPKSEEQAALDEIRKSELTCPGKTVALTEEAAKLWLLAGGSKEMRKKSAKTVSSVRRKSCSLHRIMCSWMILSRMQRN